MEKKSNLKGILNKMEIYNCCVCNEIITQDNIYEYKGEESNPYCEKCFNGG